MTAYLHFAIHSSDELKKNSVKATINKQERGGARGFLKKMANGISKIPKKKKLVLFTGLLFVLRPKIAYGLDEIWTPDQLLIEQFKLEFYLDKIRKLTLKLAENYSITNIKDIVLNVKDFEDVMNLKVHLMELKKFALELTLKIAQQKKFQKALLEKNYCSSNFRHKIGSLLCRGLFKLRIIAVSNDDSIILSSYLKVSLVVLVIAFNGYLLLFGRSSAPAGAVRRRLIYHTIGHQIYKVTCETDDNN